jgi:hypothetical protein
MELVRFRDLAIARGDLDLVEQGLQTAARNSSRYVELSRRLDGLRSKVAAARATVEGAATFEKVGTAVKNIAGGTLRVIEAATAAKTIAEKQTLTAQIAAAQRAAVGLLLNAGLSRLISEAKENELEKTVAWARFSRFGVEYVAAGWKFGNAWLEINRTTAAIADQNKLQQALSKNIEDEEAGIKSLRDDQGLLKAALTLSGEAREQAVADLKASESKAAFLDGDWFSVTTGVRAAGEPIMQAR